MIGEYEIRDAGSHRVLGFGGNDYETHYSAAIIERLIERKGLERTPAGFAHREECRFYFDPLFRCMNPQTAYIYARLFGKTPSGTGFAKFVRAGTGRCNASYYER